MTTRRPSTVTNASRPSSAGRGRPPMSRRPRPLPPSASRRRKENCSVCLPVEIEVKVDVRTVPRRRGGGMVEEQQCEIDGRVDVTGTSQTVQPLSVLQEILKRQRNILAGLASSGPLSLPQKKKKVSESMIKDNEEANDTDEQKSIVEVKYAEGTPKHTISKAPKEEHHKKSERHREHRKRGGGAKHEIPDPSLVESFDDMYEDECCEETDNEIRRKNRRLKGGTNDEFGIPEEIKKAAILKGAQMCQKGHGNQLVELFNRRRKKGGKVEISKYKRKSTLRIRSDISGIRVDTKSTAERINACQSNESSDESKEFVETKEDEHARLKGGIDNIKQENSRERSEDDERPKGGRLRGGCEMTTVEKQPVKVQTITVMAASRLRGGMERTFDKSPLGKWGKYVCRCECSRSKLYKSDKMHKENRNDLLNGFKPSLIRRSTMHMEGYNVNSGTKWSDHAAIQSSKYQSAKLLAAMRTLCEKSTEVSTSESSEAFFCKKNQRNDVKEIDMTEELEEPKYSLNFPAYHKNNPYGRQQKSFKTDQKPEVIDEFINCQTDDPWKLGPINVNKILRQKSRTCTCCINRKPIVNHALAIARKSQISVGLVNNLENSVEIDYYKNTVKRQTRLHKAKANIDPLETLQKVNEKLIELSSLAVKPKGTDDNTLPLTQHCNCYQPSVARIKRRKTRRYYESQRRYKKYAQRYGDTTESNVESVVKYESHY